jgi:hypothetical protein
METFLKKINNGTYLFIDAETPAAAIEEMILHLKNTAYNVLFLKNQH